MTAPPPRPGRLLAISDLHIGYPENRRMVAELPMSADDWLLVAGDVGETMPDIEWALRTLSERYAQVIWTPGNHELWTPRTDPTELRGEQRYRRLVQFCRGLGIITPEDPFPLWTGPGGPLRIAPLFLLYDYTFLPPGTATSTEGLALAHRTGIVCADEALLHPDPYPSREAWCAARVSATERRLAETGRDVPLVLVNHFPLNREPTLILRHPEFAMWCGTTRTADWHLRYPTAAVVYGHLHIPRVTWHDGVRFQEVSVGYPREWSRRGGAPAGPRTIFP